MFGLTNLKTIFKKIGSLRLTPNTAKSTQFQWYRWFKIIKFLYGVEFQCIEGITFDRLFWAIFMHFGCFTVKFLMTLQFCPRNQLYAWNAVIRTVILAFFSSKI